MAWGSMMNTAKLAEAIGAPFKLLVHSDDSRNFISDKRFANQLGEIHKLKNFLFEEKVVLAPEKQELVDLGPLNNMRYRHFGRVPDLSEWKLLDEKLSALSSTLDEALRQKLRIRELSMYFGTMPIWFLSGSIVAIIYCFLYPKFLDRNSVSFTASFLSSLVVWTISQGGLGACALLGTRAAMKRAEGANISETLEGDVDVTDKNILKIRILLGCLFGILLGLPFSSKGLDEIKRLIFEDKAELDAASFTFIVVPFMLGFSTNLVLAILDRFIVSIRTFFGMTGGRLS
jgi:hypothetical protein